MKKTFDPKAPKLRDDESFVKYFKMVKMGLPLGAVKNAMVKDGKDPKVIDLDPEKSLSQHESEMDSEEEEEGPAIEVVKVPKRRRKKLDWKPIGKEKVRSGGERYNWILTNSAAISNIATSQVDKASIWGDMSSYNLDLDMEEVRACESTYVASLLPTLPRFLTSQTPLVCDTLRSSQFDTLFVAQASPDQKKKKTPNTEGTPKKKKASVQVISGKRGMNCGISLARVKVDFKIVADAIVSLKENVVTNEQLPVLKECLPDRDEKFGLQQYLKKNGDR